MNTKELDSTSKEEKKAVLVNAISTCMKDNHMTMENLDEAHKLVDEIYRKNATL